MTEKVDVSCSGCTRTYSMTQDVLAARIARGRGLCDGCGAPLDVPASAQLGAAPVGPGSRPDTVQYARPRTEAENRRAVARGHASVKRASATREPDDTSESPKLTLLLIGMVTIPFLLIAGLLFAKSVRDGDPEPSLLAYGGLPTLLALSKPSWRRRIVRDVFGR